MSWPKFKREVFEGCFGSGGGAVPKERRGIE